MDDIGESEDIPDTDVGAQNVGGFPTTTMATLVVRTAWEQTITALQQLGIIVFVALLVGSGFMLMVGIELALGWCWERLTDMMGTKKKEDPENPAALVGSFKRYK